MDPLLNPLAYYTPRSISENVSDNQQQSTQQAQSQQQAQSTNQAQSQSYSTSFIPNYSEEPILEAIAQQAQGYAQPMLDWANQNYAASMGNVNKLLDLSAQYASPQHIAADMGAAEATGMQAQEAQRKAAEANLASYGIDPSSGRYQELEASNRVLAAASAAGLGNQQRISDYQTQQALLSQGIAAQLQAQQTSTAQMQLPNQYLATAMQLKYPPLGNMSQSESSSYGQSTSSGESTSYGQSTGSGGSSGFSLGAAPNYGSSGGSGSGSSGGGSGGTQMPQNRGGGGSGQPGGYNPGPNPYGGLATNQGGMGGGSGGGNYPDPGGGDPYFGGQPESTNVGLPGTEGDYAPYQPQESEPAGLPGTEGDYAPYSSGGDYYGYALGGPIATVNPAYASFGGGGGGGGGGTWTGGSATRGGEGNAVAPFGMAVGGIVPPINPYAAGGGVVPPAMSPSAGARTDDVPAVVNQTGGAARLNADEFVIPRDVALWKGQEFFQKMIEKSRQDKSGAPARAQQTGRG